MRSTIGDSTEFAGISFSVRKLVFRKNGMITNVASNWRIEWAVILFGVAIGNAGGAPRPIQELTDAYFRNESAELRKELARELTASADGDAFAVAREIRNLTVWELQPRVGTFEFKSVSGDRSIVHYHLPEGYDPGRSWPVVFCQPEKGVPPIDTIESASRKLRLQEFIIVCPERAVGGEFRITLPQAPRDPRQLVRQMRRLLHCDSDRTFLFGQGDGGDCAWIMAMTHPDLFAGTAIFSGYPRVPYPHNSLTLLLGNLKQVPVVSVESGLQDSPMILRDSIVRAFNRGISTFAAAKNLPFTSIELSSVSEAVAPSTETTHQSRIIDTLLGGRRGSVQEGIDHWFRYAAHGQANWLRQTSYLGEEWTQEQLSIQPPAHGDRDAFTTEIIAGKLAHLSGHMEGQTLHIRTRRCAEIEVMLPLESIDWNRPVTILCNGRRRHHGVIRPSVSAMLENAFDNWDFRRLIAAKLRIAIRSED